MPHEHNLCLYIVITSVWSLLSKYTRIKTFRDTFNQDYLEAAPRTITSNNEKLKIR